MLIEDCPLVRANTITKGVRDDNVTRAMSWPTGFTANVTVSLDWSSGRGLAWFGYRIKGEPVVCEVALVLQPGLKKRWYFVCPLEIGGKFCGRLAGNLYLAKFGWFGCRYCQKLRYRSEKANKANRLARDPKALRRALRECKTVADKKALIDAYLTRKTRATS